MSKYNLNIISTGRYLPEKILTNDDLSKIVDTSDEWIYTRTGIKSRHIAKEDENVLDMAYHASLDAINNGSIDKDEIDLIIIATITNNVKNPSVANRLQKKLDIKGQVMTFDINAACTGFVYALEVASSLVNNNTIRKALVIGSEKMSSVTDWTDRNTCVLFGDGAGAMIIEKGNDASYFYNDSSGDLLDELTVNNSVKMDGRKVYQFAVDIIPKSINKVLSDNNLTLDEVDYFIPHQANVRIIDSFIKTLNIDKDKVLINIDKYGNTSAASIPIAISEYNEVKNDKKKTILIVGFGGGFTWGAAVLKI